MRTIRKLPTERAVRRCVRRLLVQSPPNPCPSATPGRSAVWMQYDRQRRHRPHLLESTAESLHLIPVPASGSIMY